MEFWISCCSEEALDVYLPEQLTEHSGGELRVLPTAEAKQLHCLFRVAAVLNDLLHVARPHKQDLCHQLLHRHHWSRQVGVPIWVRKRGITCRKYKQKLRWTILQMQADISKVPHSSSLRALSSKLCLHSTEAQSGCLSVTRSWARMKILTGLSLTLFTQSLVHFNWAHTTCA